MPSLPAADPGKHATPNILPPSLWVRVIHCRSPILESFALEESTPRLCFWVLAGILAFCLTHKGFSEDEENGTCVARFSQQSGIVQLTALDGAVVFDPHHLMGCDGFLVKWCLVMGLTMLGGTLFVVSAFVAVDLYTWNILKHRANTVAKQVAGVFAIAISSVIIGYTCIGCAIIFSNAAAAPRACNYASIAFGVSAYTLMVCHCYATLACVGSVFLSLLYGLYYPRHVVTPCLDASEQCKEKAKQSEKDSVHTAV